MNDLEFSPLGGYLWGTPKERKRKKGREEKKEKNGKYTGMETRML